VEDLGGAPTQAASTTERRAQLTAAWDVRGIDIETVVFEHGTAVARRRLAFERPWVATLPSLLAGGPEGAEPQFRLGDVLGEGGMGIVRTAEQVALGREVAIKSTRREVDVGQAVPQLLREARVTGVLEHPNVVPIYAFGRDEGDRPLLVMRRVQGASWGEVLAAEREDRPSDGYVRRHLGILKQVALAAHFAHDKGIVHRDLKPDNVMIGGYGEVYVLDWGIAVSMHEGFGDVPLARDVAAIEGTPVYMSPEMAAGDGEIIGPLTDVYLLGAILHEVVTGQPPHDGPDLVSMLTHAFASDPAVYPPEVPRDLAEICHRAMARHPADRYPSAAAFAEALDEFLVHRSSTQLSDEAEKRLATLSGLLEEVRGKDDSEVIPIYTTFRECSFAFSQALRSWPDNLAARRGLQRSLELMIAFELGRDAPQAAANLLAELPEPVEALARKVERALARWRDAQSRLEALQRDADLRIGQHLRRPATFVLGQVWAVSCVAFGVLTRNEIYHVGHFDFALANLLVSLGVAGTVYAGREHLLVNKANRRLSATATTVFVAYAALWSVAGALAVAAPATAAVHGILGGSMWALAAINVERRWLPVALSSASAVVLILALPAYYFEVLGITGGVGSAFAAWWTRRADPPSSSPRSVAP
jgi:eukaryotic-like serine/threonine-protein kinase